MAQITDEYAAKWIAARVHVVSQHGKRVTEMSDPECYEGVIQNVYEVIGFNRRLNMAWVSLIDEDGDYDGYNADMLLMLSDPEQDLWDVMMVEPRCDFEGCAVQLEMVK